MGRQIHIEIPREKIAGFCRKWGVKEFALFGSVMRDDFGPDSDVDVLVVFNKSARPSLFDLAHMQDELKGIFGREVDLISRRGVEASRNRVRREAILGSAEVVYAA